MKGAIVARPIKSAEVEERRESYFNLARLGSSWVEWRRHALCVNERDRKSTDDWFVE